VRSVIRRAPQCGQIARLARDDEAGNTTAVRLHVHGGEELDQVHADDAVEHFRRRRAGDVDRGRHAQDP
jgi:hypothetical protein